jgi:hypothetical protein
VTSELHGMTDPEPGNVTELHSPRVNTAPHPDDWHTQGEDLEPQTAGHQVPQQTTQQ